MNNTMTRLCPSFKIVKERTEGKEEILCLLCRKYLSIGYFNRHLAKCEKKFKKAKGIHGNYNRRKKEAK